MIWLILNLFSIQASLTNLWISVNDTLEINLLDYLAPINDQLTLSGSYNISGISGPTLSQSFQKIASCSTNASGTQKALIVANSTLYTSYPAGVYAYNITSPQNIPLPTVIQFSQNAPEYLDSVSLPTGNFLVSVEGSAIFRVVNLTSNIEIINLTMTISVPNLNNAIFYNDGQYIWTILTNNTNMMILQTDLLVAFKTVSYLNLTVNNFANLISFKNYVIYQGLYFACSQKTVFNISSVLKGASSFIPYWFIFDDKLTIGSFMQCSLNGQILSYSTFSVLLIYNFPSFKFIAEHQGYINVTSGLRFAVSSSGSAFTVISNNASGLTQTFTNFDTLYGWFLLDETTVLVNTANAFTFYSLNLPTLTFSPALSSSQFNGTVAQSESSWSVLVTASNSPTILQYTTATQLRDYSNGINYIGFIPLSNFIKGSNLTFTLGANNGLFLPIPPLNLVSIVTNNMENSNDFLGLASLNIDENALDQTLLSTIALSNYLIYVYANIIKVAYYSQGHYNSFVSIYPKSGNSISCAAVFNSSILIIENYYVAIGKYYISYDIYNLNGQYINNVNISSFSVSTLNSPSSKMAVPNNLTICTVSNGGFLKVNFDITYVAYEIGYTSGSNLVDLTTCSGSVCGVGTHSFVYFNPLDDSSSIINVPENNIYIKILAVQDFVLIVGNQYVYQYPIFNQPFWNNGYTVWPLPCNLTDPTLFLSSSQQFFSIQCQGNLNIYDIYAEPYLNPYLSISFSGNLYLSSDTFMPSYGYTISSGGVNTTSYSLCPTFETNIAVDNSKSCNYWGWYNTSFNSSSMADSLNISAMNAIGNLSNSAFLTIINSNYILANKTFDPSSSPLTSGTISVKQSSFSSVVPSNAVIGNNITYSLNADGARVFPTSTCANYSLFCIESHAYNSGLIFPSPANEFSVSGSSISVLSNSTLYVYLLNTSIANQFTLFCGNCSQINLLPGGTQVVGFNQSFYPSIFCASINSPSNEDVSSIQIGSEPLWIFIDEYMGKSYIYTYDGSLLQGMWFSEVFESTFCLISNINYQGAFNPVAAYYWTDSSSLVVDQFTGIFEVGNYGNMGAILLYSYNNSYSAAGSLIYNDILVLFTSTADVYFLNSTNFELINFYLNPTPSTFYQLYAKATYNYETNLLAYVVSITSNSGYIRVLNCTNMLSLIDYYIDFVPQQIPVNMGFIQNNTAIQAYYLSSQGIQTLTIRNNVNVYIESYKKKYDSVMRLIAVSGGTLMVFNSVNITYPYSSDSSGVSLDKIYNKWWLCFIILAQSSLL